MTFAKSSKNAAKIMISMLFSQRFTFRKLVDN